LERAFFVLKKSSFNIFSHFYSDAKKLIPDRKGCCLMVKLQGLFFEVFGLSCFSDWF